MIIEAMKQALEALENSQRFVEASANAKMLHGWGEQLDTAEDAITSLHQAISELEQRSIAEAEKQERQCENCGEFGPCCQKQEPVAWRWKREGGEWQLVHQQPRSPTAQPLYTTPPAALVQDPQPEPPSDENIFDAWVSASDGDGIAYDGPSFECGYKLGQIAERDAARPAREIRGVRSEFEAMFTTPPAAQRQWQSLTDEEITALKRNGERYISSQEFARAIEAKLKQKNGFEGGA